MLTTYESDVENTWHGIVVVMKWFVVALSLSTSLCSCQESRRDRQQVVLTVGAGHDLSPFPSWHGSAAYALELAYEPADTYVTIEELSDSELAMTPRPDAPYSIEFLCERVFGPYLRKATRLVQGACVVEFEPGVDKNQFIHKLLLETGPYFLAWQGTESDAIPDRPCEQQQLNTYPPDAALVRMILCERDDMPIDEIHLVATPVKDSWQNFLAGQIDVIPHAPGVYLQWLEEMRSIRLVSLKPDTPLVLLINTSKPPWSNVDARRALARILKPDAISNLACNDARCRDMGPMKFVPAPAKDGIELPSSLVLSVFEDHIAAVKAAEVIKYQLFKHSSIGVRIHAEPIKPFNDGLKAGDFDLVLSLVPTMDGDHSSLATRLAQVAKYENPAFSQALETLELERASLILRDEVPMIPLFQDYPFAAINERFCGGTPEEVRSWEWLADMRLCDEEHRQ